VIAPEAVRDVPSFIVCFLIALSRIGLLKTKKRGTIALNGWLFSLAGMDNLNVGMWTIADLGTASQHPGITGTAG
jgi:hypothetical protein